MLPNVSNVTLGCDPEIMLLNSEGKLVSALSVLKGRKRKEESLPCGGTIMADNVLAEFTIPPATTKSEFTGNVRNALKGLQERVPTLRLFAIPSANFPASELRSAEAKKFGCDPDFNAWTCSRNEIDAFNAAKKPFRSAGAHVHIGHESIAENWDNKPRFVTVMDAVFGVAATFIDKFDDSALRRKLYGQAGAHRPKDYGIEYRVPSNFWVAKPALTELAYDLSHVALKVFLETGTQIVEAMSQEKVIRAINESDVDLATGLIKKVGTKYYGNKVVDRIFEASMSIEDREIEKNWKLS